MKNIRICLLLIALGGGAFAAPGPDAARVVAVPNVPSLKKMDAHSPARVDHSSGSYTFQWPGVYFEAAFEGTRVFFEVGPGDVNLRVLVDGVLVGTLTKPAPGVYEIQGLAKQAHTVRIEAVTENRGAPNVFGGFLYPEETRPLPLAPRTRQIEFIGDSHTVGYGNASPKRECSSEEVWQTTDSSQAFGPKVARHYDADYQVNAMSGRGIVRNYAGTGGDTLPELYPWVLRDHATRYKSRTWHPQVIVIGLGTNDFSTQLGAGEYWKSRDDLHAGYQATYLRFLGDLRSRNPGAFIVVWATDSAEGEITSAARKVVEEFQSDGDKRVAFVPIDGLTMTGCDWHPSVADSDTIASALRRVIDGNPAVWGPKTR